MEQIYDFLFSLLIEQAYGIVAVLWVLGMILKRTPNIEDWFIPYILLVVSVLLTFWMLGVSPDSLVQAFICVAISVYSHQLIKQVVKKVKQ